MEERHMATGSAGSVSQKFTEAEVIELVASALIVPASDLTANTVAADVAEWDSMGFMNIMLVLDQAGVPCDMGNTAALQSMRGIFELFRAAGKFE
jgi:hypothetical protein